MSYEYKVDNFHICSQGCTFVEEKGNFRCLHSGKIHLCNSFCNRWFNTSEGRVCRLTGRVVGSLDSVLNVRVESGRVIKHWESHKKKRISEPLMGKVTEATIRLLFDSDQRRKVYRHAKAKFLSDSRRKARNTPNTVADLVRTARAAFHLHEKHLRKPAAPPQIYIEKMLRWIPKFWATLYKARTKNRKNISSFVAAIIQAQTGGLTIKNHIAVKVHPFAKQHAPALLQYSQLGISCRSMSKELRDIKSKLVCKQTQEPINIRLEG